MRSLSLLQLATSLLFFGTVHAVFPAAIRGNEFYNTMTGKRFVIIGVAYQPGGASGYDPKNKMDPLSDGKKCLRDAALMQRLGVNTVRVYNVNPDLDHDLCMSIFDSVGIFVLLDVNSPLDGESINRYAPKATYTARYLARVLKIVEIFRHYENLLGFVAGNEVINDERSAIVSPPYVRAVIRDIKEYLKHRNSRRVPVGYAANDDSMRKVVHDYLTCADEKGTEHAADFYGINSYQWCGDSTWEMSGYSKLYESFGNTSVPVFFSEYGCNAQRPRTFSDVPLVYGPEMLKNWQGGILYEYTEEANDYGLVNVNHQDNSVRLLKDYDVVQTRYNSLDLNTLHEPQNRTTEPQSCNSESIKQSLHSIPYFANSFDLPHCSSPICQEIIEKGIKPAKSGRIINVEDVLSPYDAFSSDGIPIKGLQIYQYDDTHVNEPSNQTTSVYAGKGFDESAYDPEVPGGRVVAKKSAAGRETTSLAAVWAWMLLLIAVV